MTTDAKIGPTGRPIADGLTASGISSGIELRAASFRLRCPSYYKRRPGRNVSGGAEEIRTPDLRLAKAALSQLSYGPFVRICRQPELRRRTAPGELVGHGGLEPPTSVLSGPRSNQLS